MCYSLLAFLYVHAISTTPTRLHDICPLLFVVLSPKISRQSQERNVKKRFALSGALSETDEAPERSKRFLTIPFLPLSGCFERSFFLFCPFSLV